MVIFIYFRLFRLQFVVYRFLLWIPVFIVPAYVCMIDSLRLYVSVLWRPECVPYEQSGKVNQFGAENKTLYVCVMRSGAKAKTLCAWHSAWSQRSRRRAERLEQSADSQPVRILSYYPYLYSGSHGEIRPLPNRLFMSQTVYRAWRLIFISQWQKSTQRKLDGVERKLDGVENVG